MTYNVANLVVLFGISVLGFGITLPAQVVSPEATIAPALKSRVEPNTEEALRAGISGNATVFVKVDKNGVPTEVKLVKWSSQNSDY